MDIFDRSVLGSMPVRAGGQATTESLPALARAGSMGMGEFIDQVARSGLSGKGGAGFPSVVKMERFAFQPGQRKCLVVNGSEHEPGSMKDRYLLESHARTVLEGALCLAAKLGASEVWFAVNENSEAAIRSIKHEVEAFNAEQLGAAYVLSDIALHVDRVPDHYIVGEETALLEALEGRTAMPRKRPPFPIESGLFGVPTLVHNVETVAHVPYIVLFGGDHHRTLGDAGKGMTLCTLGDEFVNAGVHLVPLGIPVRELLYGIGKGLRSGERIVAVQPGGPSSGFLTEQDFECSFDHVALAAAGSALGCAAVRAYGEGTDMVRVMVEVASFFEEGSCGQCPQCRMETRMLAAILRQFAAGKGSEKLLQQIPKVIDANVSKGICGLIKMPVAPVLTGLHKFEGEFRKLYGTNAASQRDNKTSG
ncbi:NADH-ubiquinone oxidoreductase-F iron-sulfur binding region domain-containing protein [Piscinibacter sp.]|uniref:NADH-ubiquinone oxidoreductase-F iron-sulfur binding region domain-containing protein n=1 Tax=Piscinibacter sp. TaxID=1903157 RepID=UPI001DC3B363|nr:NADH-ubiquinone oxidoreductase-F iron-sulfur binding region domain-containing protein [Piscinibacter sp.]MBK7531984.1 hypothetical protein [Piscinibacter sp.]